MASVYLINNDCFVPMPDLLVCKSQTWKLIDVVNKVS